MASPAAMATYASGSKRLREPTKSVGELDMADFKRHKVSDATNESHEQVAPVMNAIEFLSRRLSHPGIDKVQGMIYALAIGDSLGLPIEFARTIPKLEYTPTLNEVDFSIQFRWHAVQVKAFSCSDDSEMSLTMLRSLVRNKMRYNVDDVIQSYLNWANQSSMLGKNTRKLMKGVKLVSGYRKRVAKMEVEERSKSQSNGTLMRASPLALLKEFDVKAIEQDVHISNPNPVNLYCDLVYVALLRILLQGGSVTDCSDFCKALVSDEKAVAALYPQQQMRTLPPEVSLSITDSFDSTIVRDITHPAKGWVCNSLYIALKAFWNYRSFQSAMEFIIKDHPHSDTDTNACIAGALFGAHLGFDALAQESNTKINISKINAYWAGCPISLKNYTLDHALLLKLKEHFEPAAQTTTTPDPHSVTLFESEAAVPQRACATAAAANAASAADE